MRRFDISATDARTTPFAIFACAVDAKNDGGANHWRDRLDRMDSLVPGDFTNALRQLKVLDQPATQARLRELLEAELRFKPGANQRRIGF